MNLSIEILDSLIEEDIDPQLKTVIEIFLNGADDWPKECLTLDQYVTEIEKCIGPVMQRSDFDKLDWPNFEAWKVESVAVLKNIYNYHDPHIPLREILESIRAKISDE